MTRNPPVRRGGTLALSAALALLGSCGSEGPAEPTLAPTTEQAATATQAEPSPATTATSATSATSAGTAASTGPTSSATTSARPGGPTWTLSEPGATPDEALASWFAANTTPYVGDCGDAPADTEVGAWCTSLFTADDDRRIYRAGEFRSEYATWLLLTAPAGRWTITDVAPGGDPADVPWP